MSRKFEEIRKDVTDDVAKTKVQESIKSPAIAENAANGKRARLQQLLRVNNVQYFTEDGSLNWNGTMQTSAALATYIALVGAFLAGISPLEFALCSAVLLCSWLSFFSAASRHPPAHHTEQAVGVVVPSLSESMAELHSLQGEINALQKQFSFQTKTPPIAPDDTAE